MLTPRKTSTNKGPVRAPTAGTKNNVLTPGQARKEQEKKTKKRPKGGYSGNTRT